MANPAADSWALLGLTREAATEADVRQARDDLLDYLRRAPRPLAAWASERSDEITQAADDLLTEIRGAAARPGGVVVTRNDDATEALEELGENEDDDVVTPRAMTPTLVTPSLAQRSRPAAPARTRRPAAGGRSRASYGLVGLIVAVLCVLVTITVYEVGRPPSPTLPPDHPDISASAGPEGERRSPSQLASDIAQLRQQVEASPTDLKARLTLGVALFEAQDLAGAKEQWDAVIAADPANDEAYFNLGFWYLSQDPPNREEAEKMWQKVIEIAPESEQAHIITMHRAQLDKMPGTDSPTEQK